MPVSEPPTTPPAEPSTKRTFLGTVASLGGASFRAGCIAKADCTSLRRAGSIIGSGGDEEPIARSDPHDEVESVEGQAVVDVGPREVLRVFLESGPCVAVLQVVEEGALVEWPAFEARGEELGAGLVLGGGPLAAHAHGDEGHERRVRAGDVPHEGAGADEAAEENRVGPVRRDDALRARA